MFKYVVACFAVLALAFAAPQPGYVAPVGYSAGYVAPAAYNTHYTAPVVAASYAAPAYSTYSAYNPVAYSSYVY